jgi:hypothetical protein
LKLSGTIPAFVLGTRETKKNLSEMTGHRTFRVLNFSQPSGIKREREREKNKKKERKKEK